jgi:DNA topoisomerase-3
MNAIKGSGIRMLTYGPCQTPTLGFCVDQSEKIKKFIPETFWRVQASIIDDKEKRYNIKWCRGKIFEKPVITAIHTRLSMHYGIKEAEVLTVKRNTVKQ